MPLAPPPLEKGRSACSCAPGGDPSQRCGWIPTRLAALGDLPFSRGGGACGTSYTTIDAVVAAALCRPALTAVNLPQPSVFHEGGELVGAHGIAQLAQRLGLD